MTKRDLEKLTTLMEKFIMSDSLAVDNDRNRQVLSDAWELIEDAYYNCD